MFLHLYDIELEHTTFPQTTGWVESNLSEAERQQFRVINITACPPGKHEVSACPGYERQWKEAVLDVLKSIRPPGAAALMWAHGPMEEDGLPQVFPYLVDDTRNANRYHINGITFLDRSGYRHSWLSFEFSRGAFKRMLQNDALDLEYTRLYILFLGDDHVADVIRKPFPGISLSWIIQNNAVAVCFHRHFEGCYVLGRRDVVEGIRERSGGQG